MNRKACNVTQNTLVATRIMKTSGIVCGQKLDSYITNATGFMKLVFELIEDLDANTMYKVTMIQWSYGGEETKDVGMISCQSTFDVNRRTNEQREDCRKAKNGSNRCKELSNVTWIQHAMQTRIVIPLVLVHVTQRGTICYGAFQKV
jgi:hypothetical protein